MLVIGANQSVVGVEFGGSTSGGSRFRGLPSLAVASS